MAGKPVRLTPAAREELLDAVEYYDEQALLGDELFLLVEECLSRIQESPEALETWLSGEEVCGVVERESVPWLLGYADPVRERVEARQREASGE